MDEHTSSAVIISTLLSDYFEGTASEDALLASCKVVRTLLKNVMKIDDNDATTDKYRKINLTNPKIKERLVLVPGALDIMACAGFTTDGEFLNYTISSENKNEIIIQMICSNLDSKIKEITQTITKSSSDGKSSSYFLSEEERLKRQAKAKKARMAKKAERIQAQQRWEEDKLERQEKLRRKEAVAAATKNTIQGNKDIAGSGITIRRHLTTNNPRENRTEKKNENVEMEIDDSDNTSNDKNLATSHTTTSYFLSEEERWKRQKHAKLAKKAREAERTEAQKRWEEDKLERQEKQRRKKTATSMKLNNNIQNDNQNEGTAAEITIHRQVTSKVGEVADKLGEESTIKEDKNSNNDNDSQRMEVEEYNNDDDDTTDLEKKVPADNFHFINDDKSWTWETCLESLPRCAATEGIRKSSFFYRKKHSSNKGRPKCLKRLFRELDRMTESLPSDPNCSIWIRFDEEMPQYLRALISAPLPGPTPYSGGLFCFDMFIPNEYPSVPPKVVLLTTGGGRIRFGPNLYADGKVCLSLLGTWPGPSWDARHSTISQLLISIQGLILGVEHPYYLEPGHGGWEGNVKDGDFQKTGQTLSGNVVKEEIGIPEEVVAYEDQLRVGTVKYAMLDVLDGGTKNNDYLLPFTRIIHAHFYQNRNTIMQEVHGWLSDGAHGRQRQEEGKKLKIDKLTELIPALEEKLSKILPPAFDENKDDTNKMEIDKPKKECNDNKAALEKENPQQLCEKERDSSQKGNKPIDIIEKKKALMKEAAKNEDYILAGQLQNEIQRLEQLQNQMKKAATDHDYILAGKLQQQFLSLLASEVDNKDDEDLSMKQQQQHHNLSESDEDDENFDNDDDEMMSEDDETFNTGPPFSSTNHQPSMYQRNRHHWGTGQKLISEEKDNNDEEGSADQGPSDVALSHLPETIQVIPKNELCRLRIRLLDGKSVIRDFNKNETLSTVYQNLESHVLPTIENNDFLSRANEIAMSVDKAIEENRKIAMKNNRSPFDSVLKTTYKFFNPHGDKKVAAVAEPFDEYKLLLSHPKREFNLEMHGTKTLLELKLVPSASLTMMRKYGEAVTHQTVSQIKK